MTELAAAALSVFVLELAKTGGHEVGIRLVAAFGPYLSPEFVGKVAAEAWRDLVAAAGSYHAGDHKPLEAFFSDRDWSIPAPGGAADDPESHVGG